MRHHVNAKRYLCAVDPDYYAKLSEASRQTLHFQGGPMTAAEAAECAADSRWPAVLRFRSYDEAGKEVDLEVPTLRDFRATLERLIEPPEHAFVLSREQARARSSFRREDGGARSRGRS